MSTNSLIKEYILVMSNLLFLKSDQSQHKTNVNIIAICICFV